MIYLNTFHIASKSEEESYFSYSRRARLTVYQSTYPFVIFRERQMPHDFQFRDITVFCGDNGSGKSTILNLISEKLALKRDSMYNRSDFFDDYLDICRYSANGRISPDSRIITSDDVFNRILQIRRLNYGIDDKRQVLIDRYIENNGENVDTLLHGLDDYERWKEIYDARHKQNMSQYIRNRLVRNYEERSNGESALSFFVDAIADGGLYLLDEPENSLSPRHQLDLKYFIEDCVRHHGCQFVISTHSPFLLSLRGALIYDIDSIPVTVKKWDELECVKVYRDFFLGNI